MTSTDGDAMQDGLPPVQVAVIPVTPFRQNCSLIWNPRSMKGVVVDPGGDVEVILETVAAYKVQVERILITHGHIDHIAGAADLADALKVSIEGPHLADQLLIDRSEGQAKQFNMPPFRKIEPARWLDEGDTVDIGGLVFQVLHCPGHAPGHVVFFNADLKFAISGDVLFAGSVGRTDLPGGDHATLIRSIREKLLPLGDDVTFLPGHGDPSTFGHERLTNPFLR